MKLVAHDWDPIHPWAEARLDQPIVAFHAKLSQGLFWLREFIGLQIDAPEDLQEMYRELAVEAVDRILSLYPATHQDALQHENFLAVFARCHQGRPVTGLALDGREFLAASYHHAAWYFLRFAALTLVICTSYLREHDREKGEHIKESIKAAVAKSNRKELASMFSLWPLEISARAINGVRCGMMSELYAVADHDAVDPAQAERQSAHHTNQHPLNHLEYSILRALDGCALKVRALAAAVQLKDPSRLYKSGALSNLKALGLIAHREGLGYYRPDAPPLFDE